MNRISDFVDSFIPANLPNSKKSVLKEELESHILDKTEYYKEIGYSREQSVEKAIEDFGTDDVVKKYITDEFEVLYSEKPVVGILSGLFILIMNLLCLPLDIWVTSADYNRDPDPAGAFMSFTMIFAVAIIIIFARVKKYRKMLLIVALSNLVIAGFWLCCFYPQMAAFTVGDNLIYLTDRFTPISMGDVIVYAWSGIFAMVFWAGIPLSAAVYSAVSSLRIKKGLAKRIRNPLKKTVIFSAVYFFVTIVSCLLYPVSDDYIDDYPVWFDNYYNFISEESEEIFSSVTVGSSSEEVSKMLREKGYCTIEEYRNSLDKLTKKQFDNNLKEFDFIDGYSVWFSPDKYIRGNGFIGIKKENGTVAGIAVGNINKSMYNGGECNFGYSDIDINDDMFELFDYFASLKKGDSEAEIMSRFGNEFGLIYAKRISAENGNIKSYYRVYCYGITDSDKKVYYEKNDNRYIELFFENGMLTKGVMYDKHYSSKENTVTAEYVSF